MKVLEGEEQKIIADLIDLCGEDNVEVIAYKNFLSLEINTSFESGLCAIFSEKHYLLEDYRICVYKNNNHDEQVEIPLKFIDCLFGL